MAAITASASPTTSGIATMAVSVFVAATAAASPASALNGEISALVVSSKAGSASPTTRMESSVNILVAKNPTGAAYPSTAAAGTLRVIVAENHKGAAYPKIGLNASVTLSGIFESLSLRNLVDDLLGMWGIFDRCTAPDFAVERAVTDVNKALQLVWNNADERNYWTNETITLTLADGEDSADLPSNVQNVVIGSARRADNKQPLTNIGTVGELETFNDLFLDGETTTIPIACHIERLAQTGTEPLKCVFRTNSAIVGASTDFLIDIIRNAPRYTAIDLATDVVIPIPHHYTETLLLPIARYGASSYYLFRQQDLKATIDREYLQAMISLGLADPLPGDEGDNKQNREGKKA